MLRIFAALALAMAASIALASSGAPEFFRVADLARGAVLTIRETPDAGAPAVGEIPWNGRRIRGFGCTTETPTGRTWCRVKYRDAVGWARRRYLQPE